MNFEETGLPDIPSVRLAFTRAAAAMHAAYGHGADATMRQIVPRAHVLNEALSAEQAIPMICAQFLTFLNRDSYEFDNIRHDYGMDVFRVVKDLSRFQPLFMDPGFLGEILKDPDVPKAVRLLYMATSIAGIRYMTDYIEDPDTDPNDPEAGDFIDGYRTIASGCLGAHSLMDRMYMEDLQRLDNAQAGIRNPPRTPMKGISPLLN